MPHYLYYIIAFSIAAGVVLLSTPVIRHVGLQSGLVDQPDARKVHAKPMVRLGGVGIFLGTLVALLAVWGLGAFAPPDVSNAVRTVATTARTAAEKSDEVWGVTLGGLTCFLIGLADDLFGLSALLRLFLEILVAATAWQMGVHIEFLTIPGPGLVHLPDGLSMAVTIVWLVGMTNAINMIDGLDGLASGVAGIAALMMFVTSLYMDQPAAALIAAALAGGTLGFLRYNFNPAQIFMGDGGAYFIGFTLAGIGIIGLVKSVTTVAVILPYVILAVPILDMSAVIVARLKSGKSPFSPDNRHLHHRLLGAGLSHRSTVLFIYALTLWAGTLALAASGIPNGLGIAIAVTIGTSGFCWWLWKRPQQ
jgi:UDP-GlcNAc:undecaprenyl-phosphate/decaprenyl-phosphate GlcNAc-1-phosphate transferase